MMNFLRENTALVKIIFAAILAGLFVLFIFLAKKLEPTESKSEKIKKYATIAIFSAISIILYYLYIPFPVFTFLQINLSNLPAYIIGFLMGPFSGLMVILVRTAACLPLSKTMCVGELADLLIGFTAILTASIFYYKKKTRKRAAIALALGSGAWIIMAIILNYLLLLPFYMNMFFNSDPANFIQEYGLDTKIKFISESNYMGIYLLLGVLPFNLIITVVCSLVTYFVYKKISHAYHSIAKDDKDVDNCA